jgi:hypothetical protein
VLFLHRRCDLPLDSFRFFLAEADAEIAGVGQGHDFRFE